MSPVFLKESFILSPNKCLTRWIENKLFVKDTRTTMAGQPAKLTIKGPLLKLIYLFFLDIYTKQRAPSKAIEFPRKFLFLKSCFLSNPIALLSSSSSSSRRPHSDFHRKRSPYSHDSYRVRAGLCLNGFSFGWLVNLRLSQLSTTTSFYRRRSL